MRRDTDDGTYVSHTLLYRFKKHYGDNATVEFCYEMKILRLVRDLRPE